MTTTITDKDFRDSIAAGAVSNNLLEIIRDAESWEPESLNDFIVNHPAISGEEVSDRQTVQALLCTLHAVLEAAQEAGVREGVEARIDV